MERKPGWTYKYIDSLEQYIAINDKTGVMYTQDKTFYSKNEQELLKKQDYQIPSVVHCVKRIMEGEIFEIKKL